MARARFVQFRTAGRVKEGNLVSLYTPADVAAARDLEFTVVEEVSVRVLGPPLGPWERRAVIPGNTDCEDLEPILSRETATQFATMITTRAEEIRAKK